MKKSKAYIGFILPGFIMYTTFMIVPIVSAIIYSFFKWSGIGPMEFVGLDNFRKLLIEPRMSGIFFNAVKNNLKYLACVLFIILPLQIFLSYLLYIKIKFAKYLRMMIFLPYVISTSIIGFFAILVFDPNFGILNTILMNMGGPTALKAWLGDPKLIFPIFVGTVIWQCIGAGMMIFYADMQGIPQEILDSSVIDGANGFHRFIYIILPSIRASFTTNLTTSIIFAWTMFDIPYILVGATGGIGNRLDFVNMVFFRYAFGGTYFGETSIGFGSSISVSMFVIIFVFTMIGRMILRINKEEK